MDRQALGNERDDAGAESEWVAWYTLGEEEAQRRYVRMPFGQPRSYSLKRVASVFAVFCMAILLILGVASYALGSTFVGLADVSDQVEASPIADSVAAGTSESQGEASSWPEEAPFDIDWPDSDCQPCPGLMLAFLANTGVKLLIVAGLAFSY